MPRLEPFLLEGESLDVELHAGSTSIGLTRSRLVLHRVGLGRDVRDLTLADVRSVRVAESPDWRLVGIAPLFLVAAVLLPGLAR
ncbi:MAG: hypothetical protein FJ033_02480 [Chloroflexi bacterium]|nr:hypothetical protein [Chloroflexota bacterium]